MARREIASNFLRSLRTALSNPATVVASHFFVDFLSSSSRLSVLQSNFFTLFSFKLRSISRFVFCDSKKKEEEERNRFSLEIFSFGTLLLFRFIYMFVSTISLSRFPLVRCHFYKDFSYLDYLKPPPARGEHAFLLELIKNTTHFDFPFTSQAYHPNENYIKLNNILPHVWATCKTWFGLVISFIGQSLYNHS